MGLDANGEVLMGLVLRLPGDQYDMSITPYGVAQGVTVNYQSLVFTDYVLNSGVTHISGGVAHALERAN